jgi:hypothetical protein
LIRTKPLAHPTPMAVQSFAATRALSGGAGGKPPKLPPFRAEPSLQIDIGKMVQEPVEFLVLAKADLVLFKLLEFFEEPILRLV